MRPSAGSIAMPGPNALCERGIGYVLQCYHLAGNRRRYLDAAVAAKQIFQFTKHLAHNLFDSAIPHD